MTSDSVSRLVKRLRSGDGICPWLLSAVLMAVVVAAVGGTEASEAGAKEPAKEAGFGSLYCGPHCVRRVLQEYGIDVELIELIREMQWPAVEGGTTMQDLAAAFTRRGLYAKAVNLDPRYAIRWDRPAIVHLEKDGVAHYVVWMPSDGPMTSGRIYDNEGTEAVKPGGFDRLRTGPVLLTSDEPIAASAIAGLRRRAPKSSQAGWLWGAGCLMAVAGFGCGWELHRRFGEPGLLRRREAKTE